MICVVTLLPREREHRIPEHDVEERRELVRCGEGVLTSPPESTSMLPRLILPAERAIDDLEFEADVGLSRQFGCPCARIGLTSGLTERQCQGS